MVALGTRPPELNAGRRDRFIRLLRAEWTKFRTVPGWIIAVLVVVALPTVFTLLNNSSCAGNGCAAPPTGPGGEAVTDQFSFMHRALTGDGSITVRVTLGGTWPGGGWTGGDVGDTNGPTGLDAFRRTGDGFTVSGSGDIAPFVADQLGAGARIEDAISTGAFAAVIAAGVLGALFITAEYRRGLIRVTLAASPRRGRVLTAKPS